MHVAAAEFTMPKERCINALRRNELLALIEAISRTNHPNRPTQRPIEPVLISEQVANVQELAKKPDCEQGQDY